MSAPTLYSLIYSPWSEKARWALHHHQVSFKNKEFAPLFGAPGLKLKTGRLTKKLTVPLLIDQKTCYFDSYEIAKYAENHGGGHPLLTEDARVDHWNQISDKALEAGRALLTLRVSTNRTAMQDYLPRWVPSWLGYSLGIGIAKMGIAYFRAKYQFKEDQAEIWFQTLKETLVTLDKALAQQDYLLGQFSYADIAMSTVFQFVRPTHSKTIRVPKRSYHCWETPELATAFPHLIEWRDALYQKHRNPS